MAGILGLAMKTIDQKIECIVLKVTFGGLVVKHLCYMRKTAISTTSHICCLNSPFISGDSPFL